MHFDNALTNHLIDHTSAQFMNIQQIIASRYLFSKKNISLISTLTWISITGVTIGTALLIIVLSVFNGFYSLIQVLLLSNDPHLRIEHRSEKYFKKDLLDFDSTLFQKFIHVEYFVEGNALISRSGRNEYVTAVRGVFSETDSSIYSLSSGNLFLGVKEKVPGVVVSEQLARDLRLYLDDEISILSADGIRRSLTQFSGPRLLSFSVNGFFTMQQIANRPLALVDLAAAQRLFYLKNELSGVDIRLANEDDAFAIKELLLKRLGSSFTIKTWYDLQKPLYDIMQIEKWASYAILMIIVLVAILNIIGSLAMIVIQKKKDIAILMAMGFSSAKIRHTFQLQGFLIGIIGCGIGGSIGLGLSLMQEKWGFVKLVGGESFIIDAYPISVHFGDVSTIIISCLALCLLASWFPSAKAGQIQVADALRYE